jgi:hypothetical protein
MNVRWTDRANECEMEEKQMNVRWTDRANECEMEEKDKEKRGDEEKERT